MTQRFIIDEIFGKIQTFLVKGEIGNSFGAGVNMIFPDITDLMFTIPKPPGKPD